MSKSSPTLNTFVAQLLETAAAGHVRGVLVLSGSAGWCHRQASQLMQGRDMASTWWLGENAPAETEALSWDRARTRLGQEVEWLVIDAHAGFDAEGFGVLSGTVTAGGLLLLLTPPLDTWQRYPDPQQRRMACYPHGVSDVSGYFLGRFALSIRQTPGIAVWQEEGALPIPPRLPGPEKSQAWRDPLYASEEQRQAVEAIHYVVRGHSRRPLVLSADRGRGKSAALGIAAAQLLHKGLKHILVSAPRIAATDALFGHAQTLLPGCEMYRGKILWQGRCIEFVAPDALLLAPRETQLLLVDEAAAIPASILSAFLDNHSRIVFATTIHGYEGTGRGFALRFQQILDMETPDWKALHISTPVRWAVGDSLEQLSFTALLLDAEPVVAEAVGDANVANCQFERLLPRQLAENETDLRELFGLLVLAHYRTSPNDLRQLLDAPGQSLYVLRYQGHIVAVAVLAHEGGLEPELARQVMLGKRRVQGHLLPQSLANHAGLVEAAQLRIARIMRIAVHPVLQRKGLGGYLLQQLRQADELRDRDLLGASFGADLPLLRFWFRHDLLPVRVGLGREASSGSHALMVLAPLTDRGETLYRSARERFAEALPELLAEPLAGLESELADSLLAVTAPLHRPELGQYDWSDLESFAFGLRGYENCMSAIRKLVLLAWKEGLQREILEETEQLLLEEKVLQRHSWQQLCRDHGFSGRKEALQALRKAISELYRFYRAK